jgi:hypothetical protein
VCAGSLLTYMLQDGPKVAEVEESPYMVSKIGDQLQRRFFLNVLPKQLGILDR